ncbi:translation elongation factor-like protein [Candidatus Bathyarchaeota archaeon]|nr:MAG: translation elongation factor-like protein [Candidatus Bathyarchaeota archaeon]
MSEKSLKEVGKVTHYFTRIGVAVIELTDTLSVGDRIQFQGATTNFEQTVTSMQIEHKNVTTAEKGQSVGLKVEQRVREGDIVYKIM